MSQDSAALSLLSLSIAASNAQPIPLAESAGGVSSKHPGALSHHRRLSSTGRRRRLSDARDAASRPLSVGTPALSMAALSLSSSASPPPQAVTMPASAPTRSSVPIPIAHTPSGRKKRGIDHKCESCSKIYRHPSCLIKHRWEHTPHWRTLSSLPHPTSSSGGGGGVLSKHAQVQMLEAAAILSHLSPDSETGTSLPEDRGMWPRWVSGGALEGEGGIAVGPDGEPLSFGGAASEYGGDVPASYGGSEYGSVGGTGRSAGRPRLHDYEVPRGAEVRAGVVEVPHRQRGHGYSTRHSASLGRSLGQGQSAGSAWSVPRSVSVSASVSSEQSRERSTPSDDEEVEDAEDAGELRGRYVDVDGRYVDTRYGGARVWKREEEEEFGFEFDLGGVREEEEEDLVGHHHHAHLKERGRHSESLRWGGMEEMDDIDMDMD
ncbi:hypothetical protein C8R43DRAFT_517571 [Mycena crocata]|nr:hypothetical protein C8R43DRAFT_517571 [Mycena crocata]